jgi:two-component system, OmpR family, phosphate regulon response regulator PhoB
MVAPALAGASLAPRTVLVVDDDAPLRALCRATLVEAGFRVLEAADGDEALELIARDRPDLILLDVMMPRLSGWAVAAELLAEPATGEIPIIFVSGRREAADRLRAQELSASGYVTKPFDPDGLAATVSTVLDEIDRGERKSALAETLTALKAEKALQAKHPGH